MFLRRIIITKRGCNLLTLHPLGESIDLIKSLLLVRYTNVRESDPSDL